MKRTTPPGKMMLSWPNSFTSLSWLPKVYTLAIKYLLIILISIDVLYGKFLKILTLQTRIQ